MNKNLFQKRTFAVLLLVLCHLLMARPVFSQQAQYRGSRETAGYIAQTGWEAGLLRANPNLSHFMWSPMTTMIQAPVAIRVGTEIKMTRPDNHDASVGKPNSDPPIQRTPYVKPIHVATPTDQPNNSLGGHVLPRHYVKPIKADLNGKLLARHYIKPIHEDVSATLINRSTYAQLAFNQAAPFAAPTPASYGEGPHIRSGMVTRAKSDVNGTVVSRGHLLGSI